MNSTAKRWIICMCFGMCVPAAIYSWRAHVHRNDRYAPAARALGVDVDTWADLSRALKGAGTRHTLSDRELDQIAIWSHDSNKYVRIASVSTLRACTDRALSRRVFALARPCLNDPDSGVRLRAVNLLWKLADPAVNADLAPMITDPDPAIRDAAKKAIGSAASGPGDANGH